MSASVGAGQRVLRTSHRPSDKPSRAPRAYALHGLTASSTAETAPGKGGLDDSHINHHCSGRYTMNAPASITITPVRVADLLAEGERMPVYVHVIDHPDARVLVDTGMT